LIVTDRATLGYRYQTDFVQTGGTASIKNLYLGGGSATAGTANYTLSGSGQLEIPSGGMLSVGYNNGGTGNLAVNGGTISAHGDVYVGAATNTNGTVTQTGGQVTINPANALRFRSTGSYSGTYNLNGGMLTLAAIDYTDATTQHVNFDGGTLQCNGTLNTNMPMTINAGGATFDTNGNSATLGGVLTGAGALAKTGDGTLTLTAANNYASATTIGQGTLALTGGGSIAGSLIDVHENATFDVSGVTTSPYTLAAGQTLQGKGTVIGDLSILGAVAPGSTPGILHTDSLWFESGSELQIEINGPVPGIDYDQLDVTGSVNLASGVALQTTLGFAPPMGGQFVLINNDGDTDPVVGQFDGLPEGATLSMSYGGEPYSFLITYKGLSGNDVVLTNVPEPGALVLLALGGLMAGAGYVARRHAKRGRRVA